MQRVVKLSFKPIRVEHPLLIWFISNYNIIPLISSIVSLSDIEILNDEMFSFGSLGFFAHQGISTWLNIILIMVFFSFSLLKKETCNTQKNALMLSLAILITFGITPAIAFPTGNLRDSYFNLIQAKNLNLNDNYVRNTPFFYILNNFFMNILSIDLRFLLSSSAFVYSLLYFVLSYFFTKEFYNFVTAQVNSKLEETISKKLSYTRFWLIFSLLFWTLGTDFGIRFNPAPQTLGFLLAFCFITLFYYSQNLVMKRKGINNSKLHSKVKIPAMMIAALSFISYLIYITHVLTIIFLGIFIFIHLFFKTVRITAIILGLFTACLLILDPLKITEMIRQTMALSDSLSEFVPILDILTKNSLFIVVFVLCIFSGIMLFHYRESIRKIFKNHKVVGAFAFIPLSFNSITISSAVVLVDNAYSTIQLLFNVILTLSLLFILIKNYKKTRPLAFFIIQFLPAIPFYIINLFDDFLTFSRFMLFSTIPLVCLIGYWLSHGLNKNTGRKSKSFTIFLIIGIASLSTLTGNYYSGRYYIIMEDEWTGMDNLYQNINVSRGFLAPVGLKAPSDYRIDNQVNNIEYAIPSWYNFDGYVDFFANISSKISKYYVYYIILTKGTENMIHDSEGLDILDIIVTSMYPKNGTSLSVYIFYSSQNLKIWEVIKK